MPSALGISRRTAECNANIPWYLFTWVLDVLVICDIHVAIVANMCVGDSLARDTG